VNPFTKVTVHPDHGENSCKVNWEINKEDYEGSEFFVRKSPDGERNIEIIQQSLPEECRDFIDKKFYVKGRTERVFYQVILRQAGIAYHSSFVEASGRKIHTTKETVVVEPHQPEDGDNAQQDDGVLETQDRVQPEPVDEKPAQVLQPLNREFGILQQIKKLELLNMKHTGNPCVVLKPKKIGEISYAGIDQDTGQDVNVFGEDRFGKLYKGGYDKPIYTYMLGLKQRQDITIAVQTGEGEVDKYAYAIRMLASPRIAHDDIIVDTTSDTRYAVKTVDRHQFKGVHDAVQMVMAVALDRSSVVYNFKISEHGK
jgi:hypothetical protein